jgi:hypothetical protein
MADLDVETAINWGWARPAFHSFARWPRRDATRQTMLNEVHSHPPPAEAAKNAARQSARSERIAWPE